MKIDSLLLKIDEVCYNSKLTNVSIIGISEPRLNKTILPSTLGDDGYDLPRLVQLVWGDGVACFIKFDCI